MKKVIDYLIILLGSFIYAAATNWLVFPRRFSFGGSSGLALLLAQFLPLSPSAITSAINVILMILALIILGRQFAVRTLVGSAATTGFVYILDLVPFADRLNTGYAAADLILAVLLIALASAMMFSVNASSGGTDIVAMIITHKNPKLQVGTALFISDIIIIIFTGILLGARSGITSFIGLFLKALLIDAVMRCFQKMRSRRHLSDNK